MPDVWKAVRRWLDTLPVGASEERRRVASDGRKDQR
jgi:hypothetical protein